MYRRTLFAPILVVLAILGSSIACGFSESSSTHVPTEPQPIEPTSTIELPTIAEPTAEPSPSKVTFLALSVIDPSPPGMFYVPIIGSHLVSIEIVIDNQSTEAISVNPLSATLVDDQGIVHMPELGASDQYGQIATLDLFSGERIKGWISFAIEDGSFAAKVKYELDMWTGDTIEAIIGDTPFEPQWELYAPVLTAPNLGDAHTLSGYSITAEALFDPALPSSFYSVVEGTRLIAVQILVRNVSGAESLSVNPLYCYLVDESGFVYEAELGATDLGQIDTLDLATGEAAQGYVAFQIPADHNPFYIRYSTDFWGFDEPLLVGLSE